MASNYTKDDPVFGTIDLDDQYVTDSWLIDKYVGGQLWAWGENGYGQLGQGNTTYYSSPVQVGNLNNWKQISAGQTCSIAIKTDGTLWSWGWNSTGQLGQGNTTNYSSPVQVGALTVWKQVSTGYDAILGVGAQAAAITTSGALWMWGSNLVGQLGINTTGTRYYSSPVQVGALTNWKQVSCENNCSHVLSVKTDGTLWAWGANQYGQLGINTTGTTYYSSPVQVGTLTNWKQVSNGQWTSFAIKTDGTLWAWGYNASSGSLGLGFSGNSSYYSSPVQVGALNNWKQVSSGLYYSSAIKTDGTLWAWGENVGGQLGQGNTTSYSSPVQIGTLTNWKQVSSGYQQTLAVKTDGTLWTWGANQSGQLGQGNRTYYSSPVQVGSLTNWKYAGAGVSFNSAITFADLT
jgi:alpha-tubulin suppressor-like RCC1 family protein